VKILIPYFVAVFVDRVVFALLSVNWQREGLAVGNGEGAEVKHVGAIDHLAVGDLVVVDISNAVGAVFGYGAADYVCQTGGTVHVNAET